MATTTNHAHVNIALHLKGKSTNTYLVLGKKNPWANEQKPPAESKSKTELDEIIGYKRVNRVSLCRPKRSNEKTSYSTITYLGKEWVLIPDNLAKQENAYYVFFETRVNAGELPATQYRQVGIQTGLTPKTGVNKPNLVPSEVQTQGTLEFYENRVPQTYSANTNIIERFIVNCNVEL